LSGSVALRLLLVDDHPMIHEVLAAVSRTPKGVDLVLLDLGLPVGVLPVVKADNDP